MNLTVIYGKTKNEKAIKALVETLTSLQVTGTLYIGYPILALANESITLDALLVADKLGLVVFLMPQTQEIDWFTPDSVAKLQDKQDQLFYAVTNHLGRHDNLRKKRQLAVAVNVVSFFPYLTKFSADKAEVIIATNETLGEILAKCQQTEPKYLPALNAAIQKITTIKPVKKRDNVNKTNSKGAILKKIDKQIANLDDWQKQAAIETPDGPMRIRGLAGAGKTMVLALKAAYLHSLYPDWHIAVTFHTQTLAQQFKTLIRRFSYEHSNDEPNWDKLQVLHAWGNRSQPGLYSEIATRLDYPVRDFLYGKTKYGPKNAFKGVCNELIAVIQNREVPTRRYDAVLIDEAQDLPRSFFKRVYRFLTPEKRVVWAYDELQNLTTDNWIPQPEILFGHNELGQPNVRLTNTEGAAHQDIILPICYRNTPWALTVAHSLGSGIYRQTGLVQLFEDDAVWEKIGYELIGGQFQPNARVVLRRKQTSFPKFFTELLSPDDAISCHQFEDFEQEINWIADQVFNNLHEDELDADDILIILADARTAKTKANQLILALRGRGIQAHLAGVTSSVDELFSADSVAITTIELAKGNEAPMVYVANSDYCASGFELLKLRNGLFTAITRSRAWVRLCGGGDGMQQIKAEFDALKSQNFSLNFTLPDEADKLRTLNRDRNTTAEKAKLKRAIEGIKDFLELVENKKMDINTLPVDLRQGLERIIIGGTWGGENCEL
jgi:superfamily I DNA and RNA helicase